MRLSSTDLRSLQVFRAIVEFEGFAGAQLALGMSQSTVSFHLKSLEDRLGFKLCTRGRRGFELTERGLEVFERSNNLVSYLSSFESRMGELRNTITGALRIGIVDNTITDPALPLDQIIRDCLTAAPEADLSISIATPDALVTAVEAGALDIAVTAVVEASGGFRQQKLHKEASALYCGQSHELFSRRQPPTVDEIQQMNFAVRPQAFKRDLQHFPKARVKAHASNMEAQAMLLLSGVYVGYLPEHYARQWVKTGRLKPLLSPQTRIMAQFVMLTMAAREPSPLLQLFMKTAKARAAR
jgi:LysR family transcriptional regulator, transcriptional activator for bauABCD operon